MEQTVGFIGLGIMGAPMAANLLKAGVPLMVNDIDGAAQDKLAALGAKPASKAEIGAACPIIFTMLPNGEIVYETLFAEGGAALSMAPGGVVCDLSSVTPQQSKSCRQRLEPLGVGFVDAPVSGGEPKAIDGTLALMAGGAQEDFDRLLPYLQKMGSSVILVGSCGSGSVTKLANQTIVGLTMAAVSEAFVMAVKAGADPEKVFNAIRGGLAGSAVLEAKLPMMLARDFKPGGKLSINYKDIKNVLATAHEVGAPAPFSAALLELIQALVGWGHADEDHSCTVKYFEALAGTKVEPKA